MERCKSEDSSDRLRLLDKLTGSAVYGGDVRLPDMVFAKGVCWNTPHARIEAIHTDACMSVPGVLGVFTAKDLPGEKVFGLFEPDEPIFAERELKFAGDVAALVVAESREAAEEGAKLVTADLTPLPAVLDIDEALLANVKVSEKHPDNLCDRCRIEKGDARQGLADSDFVVDAVYTTSRIEHAYLEPEVIIAVPSPNGTMEIRGSMQHPFYTREVTAKTLGISLDDVTVNPNVLGGSFGGKVEITAAMAGRAAIAAQKLGRPVMYELSREESIQQRHKRHGIRFRMRLGAKADGTLNVLSADAVMDGGAYVNESPIVAWKTVTCGQGPYRIPNVRYETRAVMTHNVVCGAMRGFGTPQSIFAMESAMNELAQKLGISPLELRRKNLLRKGDRTATNHTLDFSAVSISDVMERAAAAIRFEEKFEAYSKPQTGRFRRGVGIGCSIRGVSFGADVPDIGRARIRLCPDGTVELFCPMMDMGQGADTTLTKICSLALRLPMRYVRRIQPDTAENPDTGAAGASRGTFIGGNAILACVEKLRAVIAGAANIQKSGVRFENGAVRLGDLCLSFRELYEFMSERGAAADCTAEYAVRDLKWDGKRGQGEAYVSYTYSCHAAEVEVDSETGKTRLIALSACHDSGRVINPPMAAGQVSGGLVMGAGMALLEQVVTDPENGSVVNDNFDTYLLPTAADTCDPDIMFEENPDDAGPLGGKSLGEPSMEPAAAAIMGAVNMAVGSAGAVRSIPADLETVFFAMHPECRRGEQK